MNYAKNILETIGNTPLVKLNTVTKEVHALVLAKIETFNPSYLVTDEEGIAKAKADGEWIESGAHLMLFPADPSTLDGQTNDFNSGAPYVMFAGTEYAHLMIPVEGYYDYQAKK